MKRDCYFCKNNIKEIDYKNAETLSRYLDPLNKIKSPRYTGICASHQRKLANSIKRARIMGII